MKVSFDELSYNEKMALRYTIAFPFGGVGDALKQLDAVNKRGEPDYNGRVKGEESLKQKGLVRVLKDGRAVVSSASFGILPKDEAVSLLQMLTVNVSDHIRAMEEEKQGKIETQRRADTQAEILERLGHLERMVSEL